MRKIKIYWMILIHKTWSLTLTENCYITDKNQKKYKLNVNENNPNHFHLEEIQESKVKQSWFQKQRIDNFCNLFQTTFLPSNKESKKSIIPDNYLRYIGYNAIQDISTQIRSIIATQRVFEGVGVGMVGASAASASLQFLMRDGVGMASSLLFTARHGSHFGNNVKQWKFFADMIVDLGILLEVVTYYLPKSWFLPLLCIANMCKAICGVAAGSCGGAISVYWAEKANTDISDIHAKFGAQNTVTGSIGLIFAALFARSISHMSQSTLWCLFGTLTFIHLYANRQCMKMITIPSLNTIRFNMIVFPFLQSNICPTPDYIAKKEPLIPWRYKYQPKIPISLGVPLKTMLNSNLCINETYIIQISHHHIRIAFRSNCNQMEKAKAYFHACILSNRITTNQNQISTKWEDFQKWENFQKCAQTNGWNLNEMNLSYQNYEYTIK